LKSLLNFPSLIAAEQYAHCPGAKSTFGAIWGKKGPKNLKNFWVRKGPENPEKFHRDPSRGCIESIKSAGERCQKVTLIIFPRHFLETRISCRIYIPKNAILQVNPLETSLKFRPFFPFAIFCFYKIPSSGKN